MYGKLVPTISSVSQSSISSSLGLVPSSPRPPVAKGESSGTTVLPGSVLTIGAPSASATASTSLAGVPRAPTPARMAIFRPALSTSAAACRSSSAGQAGGGR